MSEVTPTDGSKFPQPPRFLIVTRTAVMAAVASILWVLIELVRFCFGAQLWHIWDASIFIATALAGSGGVFRRSG